MYWYIDSIDARSGRAFATCRAPDLLNALNLDEGACYFIEPPAFDPVPADRGIAFAAIRSGYQEGLFLEGGAEVPFAELTDVAEFVRRSYLRRGGGSGGGTGEPGPPGSPPPPFDPEEPASREGSGDVGSLEGLGAAIDKQSATITLGLAQTISYDVSTAIGRTVPLEQRIAKGAMLVGTEFVRGMLPPSPGAPYEPIASGRRLFNALGRMGLMRLLSDLSEGRPKTDAWFASEVRRLGYEPLATYIDSDPRGVTGLIFLFISHGDLARFHDFVADRRYYKPLYWFGHRDWDLELEDDPIGLLGGLDAPVGIAVAFAAQNGKPATGRGAPRRTRPVSVAQMLFAYLAAPQLLQSLDKHQRDEALNVILFAAACIALPSVARRFPTSRYWDYHSSVLPSRLAVEADAWIRSNLPRAVFSGEVEQLVSAVDAMSMVS